MATVKTNRRKKIHMGIRRHLSGTALRPRLSVFRSNSQIYAQLIDDVKGVTLASSSSQKLEGKMTKVEASTAVGKELAAKALEAGITSVVFDRGGYLYHGRIKALVDGAREGGLKF